MAETISFDRERFARMLDQVVADAEVGRRLDANPLETLREFGFDLREDVAREVEGKTLGELQQFDPLGPRANVAVSVGIDAGVVVMINVGIHTKARENLEDQVINPVIRDRITTAVEERVRVIDVFTGQVGGL